eukprot:TRINITY_DN3687_c0_g2_i1.p1 TRINITY_DN3687_c0_g2~~TRINITY_DN3687_c0_g2_i1.p1  ORF type:complete len:798 (-),score=175.44 TRINITY_DN3687_c0_g2_i1:284-2677(-)
MHEYAIVRAVGSGAFAHCYLAKRKSDEKLMVLKQFNKLESQQKDVLAREVRVLANLHHPNVIKYDECFIEKGVLNIVMEYCDQGSLADQIKKTQEPFEEELIWKWILELVDALEYTTSKHILHRDLKPANILLKSGELTIKLSDFGIAQITSLASKSTAKVAGTPSYLAPEICRGGDCTSASDMWSLGCVLYEVVARCKPFPASNVPSLIMSIIKNEPKPLPDTYSRELTELVMSLLRKTAQDRPTLKQILRSPKLKNRRRKSSSKKIASSLDLTNLPGRSGERMVASLRQMLTDLWQRSRSSGDTDSSRLQGEVFQMQANIESGALKSIGELWELLGRIWGELGKYEQALACYQSAVQGRDSSASIAAVEQLANMQVRSASRKFKTHEKSKEICTAMIKEGARILETLLNISETPERLCLLGSALKRLCWIGSGGEDQFQAAADAYRKAHEMLLRVSRKDGPVDTYAVVNQLTFQILQGIIRSFEVDSGPFLKEVSDSISVARSMAVQRKDLDPADPWRWVAICDLDFLSCLLNETSVHDVANGYSDVFSLGSSGRVKGSIMDQLEFFEDILNAIAAHEDVIVKQPVFQMPGAGGRRDDRLESGFTSPFASDAPTETANRGSVASVWSTGSAENGSHGTANKFSRLSNQGGPSIGDLSLDLPSISGSILLKSCMEKLTHLQNSLRVKRKVSRTESHVSALANAVGLTARAVKKNSISDLPSITSDTMSDVCTDGGTPRTARSVQERQTPPNTKVIKTTMEARPLNSALKSPSSRINKTLSKDSHIEVKKPKRCIVM